MPGGGADLNAVLPPAYFAADGRQLAPDLLGKLLCRRTETGVQRRRITETEVYYGAEDTACHASHGRTKRTEVLYHAGGVAYVYHCYMFDLLNLVTGPAEHPECVLIRGVEGFPGPGRVGVGMAITPALYGCPLTPTGGLWVEDDGGRPAYTAGPRIGIASAAPADRARPWRFTVERT